jgi:hypothetical protein
MNYLLSTVPNSYDIVEYNHAISYDYRSFLEGESLGNLQSPLFYSIKRKADIKKLRNYHLIFSTGPELISNMFRKVIENFSDEVEFFDVEITFENEKIEGFSVINIKNKISCLDMNKSEYKPTNFDPNNPTYRFYYLVVKENALEELNIVRCKEMSVKIVVSENFKKACFDSRLSGLSFCNPLDLTYDNRTFCNII